MQAEYKRDFNHSYMVLNTPIEGKSYQVKMLVNNTISGVLKCSIRNINGETRCYYEISSKQTITTVFEKKEMNADDLKAIWSGIIKVLENLEEFLLDENYLILQPEFIYINIETRNIYLCFLPGYNKKLANSLKELSEYILNKVNHKDKEAVVMAYELYRYTSDENYSLSTIKKFLCSLGYEQGEEKSNNTLQTVEKSENQINDLTDTNEYACKVRQENTEYCTNDAEKSEEEKNLITLGRKIIVAEILSALITLGSVVYFMLIIKFPHLPGGEFINTSNIVKIAVVLAVVISIQIYMFIRNIHISDEEINLEEMEEDYEKEMQICSEQVYECKKSSVAVLAMDNEMDTDFQKLHKSKKLGDTGSVLAKIGETMLSGYYNGSLMEIFINKNPFIIGKLEEYADGIISDSCVSRMHARFFEEHNVYYLTDLNSTNGTYVNGMRLGDNETVIVVKGDEIAFANIIFNFC